MKKRIAALLVLTVLLAIFVPAFAEGEAEPVSITWYREALNGNAISGWENTAWIQEIERRTNVDITFLGPNSGDDYTQAVTIMLASGNYPDLVYMNWNNYNGGLSAAIEDGVVVDISASEEYKALMPTWFGMLEENEMLRRAVTLDDGTSALFCHVENDLKRGAYGGYAIRKDWLDRLGLEIPTTVDELYDVLVAFRDEDANGNGDPDDEIPLTDYSAKEMLGALAAAWGLRVNTMYPNPEEPDALTYWTEYNDGETFKDFVATMRQWYEEGLIDIEFASQDDTARVAKITSDQAGVFYCYTANFSQWEEAIAAANPEAAELVTIYGMVPVVGPAGKTYTTNDAHVRYAASNEGTCVTSAAEENGTIEAILKMIDFMYTEEGSEIINWGIEGESYTIDADGNHVWTDAVANDPEFSLYDKAFVYALPTSGAWPKLMDYEAWASIELSCDSALTGHNNYWAADAGLLVPPLMMNYEEAEEYNQIMTDANTAINEAWVSVILGTKPLEELDAPLALLDDMGVNRAIEIYQGVYDRYNAK